ncbi:RNA-binding protein 7-like isoform X1 [Polypterus senegalus]
MGSSQEADKTLFVGNLDPRVTEELLFELFLQAGPMITVKIPKDRDGKAKQFAFVNFKHEVSAPYGMNLLNGMKLFGRPIKIQFRSGSSHGTQEQGSPLNSQNSSPSSTPTHQGAGRFGMDSMPNRGFASPQLAQRSLSSPDSLQRHAVINSMWQQRQVNGAASPLMQPGFLSPEQQQQQSAPPPSHRAGNQWQQQQDATAQCHGRQGPLPYPQSRGHYGRDAHFSDPGPDRRYRGQREEYYHHDDRVARNHGREYQSNSRRDNKWRQSRY